MIQEQSDSQIIGLDNRKVIEITFTHETEFVHVFIFC